ncbi:MAG: hypothetical protein ACYTJ0_15915 [Planctomycetota bacterium]|jgi:hypothetical protein
MAKRRKTAKRTRAKRSAPRLQFLREIDWERSRRIGVTAGWLGLAGVVIWGWAAGVPGLRAYASAAEPDVTVELRFVDPPVWMNGDLEIHLALTGRQHLGPDPLDRSSLDAARRALLQTGWFDEVLQVRRVRRDLVEVQARFVQPYVVIRDGRGDHLVDPAGRLLPMSVPIGHASQFVVIEGARYPRPPRAGELWEGADVTAALRLKRILVQRPWHDQVTGIDVSRYHDELTLYLTTRWGHRIRWGRAPGDEQAGEVTMERKLAYLDHLDEHYGRVDGGHVGEVDITNPRGVFGR